MFCGSFSEQTGGSHDFDSALLHQSRGRALRHSAFAPASSLRCGGRLRRGSMP